MRNYLPVFLFAFTCFNANAQDKNVTIKFCPLSLIDGVSFPTIQAGVEFKLSHKISWYNELGVKFMNSYYERPDTNFLISTGYKVKTEIRYYFENNEKLGMDGRYFAANAFFIKDNHNTRINYFSQNDTSIKVDDFGVKKIVFGLNFIYGYQKSIGKKISLDLYAGIGLRCRNINTSNQEYDKEQDYIQRPIDYGFIKSGSEIDADKGFHILPNFTLGVRICYKF